MKYYLTAAFCCRNPLFLDFYCLRESRHKHSSSAANSDNNSATGPRGDPPEVEWYRDFLELLQLPIRTSNLYVKSKQKEWEMKLQLSSDTIRVRMGYVCILDYSEQQRAPHSTIKTVERTNLPCSGTPFQVRKLR